MPFGVWASGGRDLGLGAVLEGPQGVERTLGALTPKSMLTADFVPLIINQRGHGRGWGRGLRADLGVPP